MEKCGKDIKARGIGPDGKEWPAVLMCIRSKGHTLGCAPVDVEHIDLVITLPGGASEYVIVEDA